MIKKTITKELTLLEPEDIIREISQREGRRVNLNEISVVLEINIPMENGFRYYDYKYSELVCYFDVKGGGSYDSLGMMGADPVTGEMNEQLIPGVLHYFFRSCPIYLKDEEIFAFDTSEFKEYSRWFDPSD